MTAIMNRMIDLIRLLLRIIVKVSVLGTDTLMMFRYGCIKRKNIRDPDMELVTTFCPPTTTGDGETVLQTAAEPRFGEDCNVNPVALVGQLKTMLAPGLLIPRSGALVGAV